MPGFDGAGPRGQGAMTGGGKGYCLTPAKDIKKQPVRYGFNARGCGGRGMRHCSRAAGIPGWARAQRGPRAFFGYGREAFQEERPVQL